MQEISNSIIPKETFFIYKNKSFKIQFITKNKLSATIESNESGIQFSEATSQKETLSLYFLNYSYTVFN